MRTHALKINLNHLKKEIEKDYFKYRQMFFKMLVVSTCIHSTLYKNIIPFIVIEDEVYNQYLYQLVSRAVTENDLLAEIGSREQLSVYFDMLPYIEEFFDKYVETNNYAVLNVLNLKINDDGWIEISSKKIRRPMSTTLT